MNAKSNTRFTLTRLQPASLWPNPAWTKLLTLCLLCALFGCESESNQTTSQTHFGAVVPRESIRRVTATNLLALVNVSCFMSDYGPLPVPNSQLLQEYVGSFGKRAGWECESSLSKLRNASNYVGQERIQFHLNPDGRITDLKVLTNTLDDAIGLTLRDAIAAGTRYPRWPVEMCRTQYAGYLTIRMGFKLENVTSHSRDSLLENFVADSLLGGSFRSNYSISLQTNFQSDPAYLTQAMAKERTNDLAGAIADYNLAIEWDAADAWAYCHRGNCEYELKNYENALADLSKAIELDPHNSSAWNHRAIARFHFKNYEATISDCTRAIELNPGFYGAFANRAYAKMRLEDFDGALADANSSVNPVTNHAYGFWTRSRIRYYLKDYENALADCARAIEINPRYGTAYASRGYIQQKLGQDTAALESFRKALEFDHDLEYVRFLIWVIRSKAGESEQATDEIT